MAGRGSLTRRLVVAGVMVSFGAWAFGERRQPAADALEDQPLIPDRLALAGGRGLDPPKTRTFRSRLAASLVFATIFVAGAALTAGAGNELARMSESPLAEPAAVEPAEEPAAAPAPEAAPEAAPAVEPAAEPAPAELPPAAAAPEAQPEAEAPAAAPDEVSVADAPDPSVAAPAAAAPAPEAAAAAPTAAAKPAAVPAPKPAKPRRAPKPVAPKEPAAPRVAPIPLSALIFSPEQWLHDNPASPTGAAAVALSTHYLGVPYVWGGAVPATGFDCSGLTRFVYQQLGVQLPHYAASQFAMFPKLDPTQLAPGDLVFFEPKFDGPGHVALYAGGDQIIEAPHTGALVRYASLSRAAAALGFLGAVRPYESAAVVEQQLAPRFAMQSSLFARPE